MGKVRHGERACERGLEVEPELELDIATLMFGGGGVLCIMYYYRLNKRP